MLYNPLLCLPSVVVSKHIKNTWTYYTNLFNNTRLNFILINSIFTKIGYTQCKSVLRCYIFWHRLVMTWTVRFQTLNLAKHCLHGELFTGGHCDLYVQLKKYLWKSNQQSHIANNISFNRNDVQHKNGNIPKTRSRCS